MEIQRAKELLEILADGIDPLTGEVLPDDHVCNKGEIVRALHCAVEEMSRRRKRPLPSEWREASPRTNRSISSSGEIFSSSRDTFLKLMTACPSRTAAVT